MFDSVYKGRRVLLTGHTGFKGSWLAFWLRKLGAEVCGAALEAAPEPNHYRLLAPEIRSEICDIRNTQHLQEIFTGFQPETVFHLAAQPIVRLSYEIPAETFDVNLMGTVNILDMCRRTSSVRSVVVITSDKCYENKEQLAGYTENDPMGGYDPYSASKGCAELASASFARSFFNPADYGKKHRTLLATARAGNVIGGGDWAADRLIPDLMRAAASGVPARIRNPHATRPWQHVLEPLSGYLQLGSGLFQGKTELAGAWNFGPDNNGIIDVGTAARQLQQQWPEIDFIIDPPPEQPHEATLLHLDCTKARDLLSWHGVLTPAEMFDFTSQWYREYYKNNRIITAEQLEKYINLAEKQGLLWTK